MVAPLDRCITIPLLGQACSSPVPRPWAGPREGIVSSKPGSFGAPILGHRVAIPQASSRVGAQNTHRHIRTHVPNILAKYLMWAYNGRVGASPERARRRSTPQWNRMEHKNSPGCYLINASTAAQAGAGDGRTCPSLYQNIPD